MKIKKMQPGQHLLLLCAAFLILILIVLAVSNSFKTMRGILNTVPQVIPARPMVQNYIHVLSKLPLLKVTMNTLLITVTVTISKTVTGLFAAYSFVYFGFRGKGILYFIVLATIFIPFIITMIPSYLMISKIGLGDKIWGVALPRLVDMLGAFPLRQSMQGTPRALIETAGMGNVKNLKVVKDIIVPLVRSSIVSMGIIFFINSQNEYTWSVLILRNRENYTLSLALQVYIGTEGGTESTIAMTVSVMTMVILLTLYILFQRCIINTFAMSGIKGQGVDGQGNQVRRNR